jgi:5'-nucleotidase
MQYTVLANCSNLAHFSSLLITSRYLLKILVSNDDGINALGLRVLCEVLASDSNNQVYVVAPDRERSATGHGLTLHRPLRVDEISIHPSIKGSWATSGTPSDCVKFALSALLPEKPDIVISGINRGGNLGTEVLYSGTVSAAMEGVIQGVPSLAVSLTGNYGEGFHVAGAIVTRLLKTIKENRLSYPGLLNINIPALPLAQIKGFKFCRLGIRRYIDSFEKRQDPRGNTYYWLAGEVIQGGEEKGTDVWALQEGYVPISPISFDMTDHQHLSGLTDQLAKQVDNIHSGFQGSPSR